MKKFLYTLLITFIFLPLSAQVKIEGLESADLPLTSPRDTIENAIFCVHYNEIIVPDTLFKEEHKEQNMLLQIGNKVSKYADYIGFLNDSIIFTEIAQQKDRNQILMGMMSRVRGKSTNECIYKNLQPEKITVTDYLLDRYKYIEDIPVFNWKLAYDETTDILGYDCRKATCSFRGRNYTAWYTPAIPVNNGPWKFSGLPGLILRVSDDKEEYVFECTALYQPIWASPICQEMYDGEKIVSRQQLQKMKQRLATDPYSFIKNSPGIEMINSPSPSQVARRRPYNPIERD